jgi:site-specific DNA-adenine methylase
VRLEVRGGVQVKIGRKKKRRRRNNMFSYYGSKSKIAKFYPKPEYKTIIEPFAGGAFYSLLYKNHNVILNEKNSTISEIWKFLTKTATKEEILSMRDFYLGQNISELKISKPHKDLIGFCINRGSTAPRSIVPKWSCQVKSRPNWASTPYFRLTEIANQIESINHFEVFNKSYEELDNIEATWFIDPPYQHGGEFYVENKIDFNKLAEWCKSRKGQVIVCENDKADWLDFQPLINIQGQSKKSTECIWTNK